MLQYLVCDCRQVLNPFQSNSYQTWNIHILAYCPYRQTKATLDASLSSMAYFIFGYMLVILYLMLMLGSFSRLQQKVNHRCNTIHTYIMCKKYLSIFFIIITKLARRNGWIWEKLFREWWDQMKNVDISKTLLKLTYL